MSTAFANIPIVTDGLIFAIDPYNTKSYVSGDTITNNLVSNAISGGTLNNGVGYDSNSFTFDGIDQFIKILDDGSGKFDIQEYTIDVWFKTDFDGAYEVLWSYDRFTHQTPFYAQHLRIITPQEGGGNGKIAFSTNDADSAAVGSLTSLNTIPMSDNTWHNIVLTKTQTDTNIYLDGLNVATETYASETTTYFATDVWVGRGNYGNSYAKGNVGTVKFYNKALSPTEVKQNHNATKYRYI